MQDHKNCGEMTEIEAKVKYVKLARSLQTYGVSFFLVKVRVHFLNRANYMMFPQLEDENQPCNTYSKN